MNGGDRGGAPILRLALSPSRRYAAAILGAHAAAAACVVAMAPGWPGIALGVLLAALGIFAARDRALLAGAQAVRTFEILGSGEAQLVFADGRTAAAAPVRGVGVNRHWVALGCASAARRGFLVTAGMLPAEQFRLLRLWALWGKVPGTVPGRLAA